MNSIIYISINKNNNTNYHYDSNYYWRNIIIKLLLLFNKVVQVSVG